MRMRPVGPAAFLWLAIWLSTGCGGGDGKAPDDGEESGTLPMYRVEGPPVTPEQFDRLASVLDLPPSALRPDGSVWYADAESFLQLPTVDLGAPGAPNEDGYPTQETAILLDDVGKEPVLDDATALSRARAALDHAGLLPESRPGCQGSAVVGHSTFEAVDIEGGQLAQAPLDTHVTYAMRIGELPLVGPGSRIKLVFDSDGSVSFLRFAFCNATQGPSRPVVPWESVEATVMATYGSRHALVDGTLDLTSRLVYFAPAPAVGVSQWIVPHYEVGGTFLPAGGEEPISLRRVLVPAVRDEDLLPQVEISVDQEGQQIVGTADVTGGTSPFTYFWVSSTVLLDPADSAGPTVSYPIGGLPAATLGEVLSLTVTDANGFRAHASATLDLEGEARSEGTHGIDVPSPAFDGGEGVCVGAEWIGDTAEEPLPQAGSNATNFALACQAGGVHVRFCRGEYAAYERHFKDPFCQGEDTNWVDAVDACFYTGHASADGWWFTTFEDDPFLSRTEVAYGNGDLEWLAIAACGPLQGQSLVLRNAWWRRWGRAFEGLHLLCGYATDTDDNAVEGWYWVNAMLGLNLVPMLGKWPVSLAWILTGFNAQGPAEVVAVMGALGPGGLTNALDWFHGQGDVGPDIHDVRGFWRISAPCGG